METAEKGVRSWANHLSMQVTFFYAGNWFVSWKHFRMSSHPSSYRQHRYAVNQQPFCTLGGGNRKWKGSQIFRKATNMKYVGFNLLRNQYDWRNKTSSSTSLRRINQTSITGNTLRAEGYWDQHIYAQSSKEIRCWKQLSQSWGQRMWVWRDS